MGELTRRDRTVILLGTRTAWFPQPRSQFQGFGAVPGEKATERKACRRCDELGFVDTRKGRAECGECSGRGWFLVDGYTGKREPEKRAAVLSGPARAAWRRQIDGDLNRLALQLATPSEVSARTLADETPEPWERERERHYRAGDYRALDLALEWLGGYAPGARQLVEWVYEFGVINHAAPSVQSLAARTVDALNTRMPEEIRVPHWYLPQSEAYKRRKAA